MGKLCPKCGYEGDFMGQGGQEACPSCGAVREKIMKYIASLSPEERKTYLSRQIGSKNSNSPTETTGLDEDVSLSKIIVGKPTTAIIFDMPVSFQLEDLPFLDEGGNFNVEHIVTQMRIFRAELNRMSAADLSDCLYPTAEEEEYISTLIQEKYELDGSVFFDYVNNELTILCLALIEAVGAASWEYGKELNLNQRERLDANRIEKPEKIEYVNPLEAERQLVLKESSDPNHLKPGFHATPTQQVVILGGLGWSSKPSNRNGIALNDKDKTVCIKFGSREGIYSYRDILACELNENGDTITSTSRSSQLAGMAIGGLALGGLGALVGGLSGKKRAAQKVDKIEVVVTVNDPKDPLFVFCFLNHEVKRNGFMHRDALDKARRCVALATFAIKAADAMDKVANASNVPLAIGRGVSSISVADELLKLDELRSRGILSEEEFKELKMRLLSNP